jgi:hypothetical protein
LKKCFLRARIPNEDLWFASIRTFEDGKFIVSSQFFSIHTFLNDKEEETFL